MLYTESKNPYISSLCTKDVIKKMNNNEFICVKLLSFNEESKTLFCEISKNIYGILPLQEFEINLKKIKLSNNSFIYPQIERLINKYLTVMLVKKEKAPSNTFILSRKMSLKNAYSKLKAERNITCEIIGITEFFLYVDCGYGVSGRISMQNSNSKEISSFKIGQLINCEILSCDDITCRFKLRYVPKTQDANHPSGHKLYDIVQGSVIQHLKRNSTTDVSEFSIRILNSNEIAILDISGEHDIKVGNTVECFVYGERKDGKFKLSLIKKI